ncbi:MAG: phosphatase PAP2 family protein [Bacteroidales bacterium]|nr:phosphatase PAP2 family protein [Lentimicrobiaceae bacterium]MDD5693780.1 phosphatase PAP2 family protein [Bacteroidales bacterium]
MTFERIKDLDTDLFLLINGWNSPFWDTVMYWLSDKLIWIPLYLLLIYFLIRYYKKQTLIILLFVGLLIFLSDQSSVQLFKNVFQRPRPCHDPALASLVHTVNGQCGGQFSFVSSHATNHFAIAVFLIPFLGSKWKYFTPLILFWAAIISYSRVYLGVHYPGDVLGGALLGTVLGLAVAIMCHYTLKISKFRFQNPSKSQIPKKSQ